MPRLSHRSIASGLLATGVSLGLACSAQAAALPNVVNLNFTTSSGSAPKDTFTNVKPTGWTGGGGLIFVEKPGTADDGSYLSVYSPFPNPPVPGNFVAADGNPDFAGSFSQTITGLTKGATYTLSFYQAGGQQTTYSGVTTEQWIVSLGTAKLSTKAGGPVDPLYGNTDQYFSTDAGASIVASNLMTTPSHGVTPWQYVSVNLVADASTDLLSFLAWGDKGSTINLPPIVFLAGVNALPVPEPASLSVIGVGLVGLGAAIRRRRAARSA